MLEGPATRLWPYPHRCGSATVGTWRCFAVVAVWLAAGGRIDILLILWFPRVVLKSRTRHRMIKTKMLLVKTGSVSTSLVEGFSQQLLHWGRSRPGGQESGFAHTPT